MLYAALIFGLLGSFHCVGMCGPIAFLLPIDRKNTSRRVIQLLSYHLGRIFMYGILGMTFGIIGKGLNLFGIQQYVSITVGILMIVSILLPVKVFNRYNFSKPIYKLVSKIKSAMGSELKKKNPRTFFTLGSLNGLLPCGLVYMAIFGALAAGGAFQGSLYMIVFGLGTIPLMTTAIYVGNFIKSSLKQRILKAIPVVVVIIGMLFILRGLGLGIPYVSPSEMVRVEQTATQHSCH